MLDEILDDERFSAMMKEHVFECVEYLLQNDRPFSAMTNLDLVKFDPELPEYIKSTFTLKDCVGFVFFLYKNGFNRRGQYK